MSNKYGGWRAVFAPQYALTPVTISNISYVSPENPCETVWWKALHIFGVRVARWDRYTVAFPG